MKKYPQVEQPRILKNHWKTPSSKQQKSTREVFTKTHPISTPQLAAVPEIGG